MLKKLMMLGTITAFSMTAISAQAELLKTKKDAPHFYIKMENQSDKDATVSFQQDVGYVFLTPILGDHTALPAHQKSQRYGVTLAPLDPADTFNIVFTGQNDCTFKIGFFGPGNPTVNVSGSGCYGGGYKIVDEGDGLSLVLYVSDIHPAAKS